LPTELFEILNQTAWSRAEFWRFLLMFSSISCGHDFSKSGVFGRIRRRATSFSASSAPRAALQTLKRSPRRLRSHTGLTRQVPRAQSQVGAARASSSAKLEKFARLWTVSMQLAAATSSPRRKKALSWAATTGSVTSLYRLCSETVWGS